MENNNELIQFSETKKVIRVNCAMIDNSYFGDVSARHVKITNANLSDLEIEGAQLGGAYIHNIGMPPKGHPMYDASAKQRPLRFENCNLAGSTITDCNLEGIIISDCNLTGMMINGIPVEEMIKACKEK
jgi:uncharacterized protein YjbI with pentapeptide repeats